LLRRQTRISPPESHTASGVPVTFPDVRQGDLRRQRARSRETPGKPPGRRWHHIRALQVRSSPSLPPPLLPRTRPA
jgi:hypothetical protein